MPRVAMSKAKAIEPASSRARSVTLAGPVHEVWQQFEARGAHESRQDWLTSNLRGAIVAGALQPGARLPASRQLAHELQLSRNTVAIVYERLLAEGLLEARVGAGTFVTSHLARPRGRGSAAADNDRRRVAHLLPQPGDRPESDPSRPLTPGLPDLDLFPHALWARLNTRYWRARPSLGYTDPAGLPALRQAISGFIGATRGVACDPEQIFITAGTQGAMMAVFHALLEPGAQAWVEDPGYRQVWRALRMVDARPVPVPVDEHGLMVSAGQALAPKARLAIVSPSHQYPSGALMSLPRRLALLDWAAQSDAWILEDDYDGEYRYEGAPIKSLKSLDRDDRVIYVGTLSKLLAPGLRLGFMVVPDALVAPMRALRQTIDHGMAAPVQSVFADFITQGHLGTHVRKTRAVYNERRQTVLAALAKMPAIASVSGSDAGLHLVARLAHGSDRAVAAQTWERGLGLTAISAYGASAMVDLNEAQRVPSDDAVTLAPALVIGYANAGDAALDDALARLAQCLAGAYSKRRPGRVTVSASDRTPACPGNSPN